MSEQPKVVIIEDDPIWQEEARTAFAKMGFCVVAVVDNLLQATQEIIPQLEALGVCCVSLDANLDPDDHTGSDGKTMAAQIKQQAPSVKIIGLSYGPQPYANILLSKFNFDEVDKEMLKSVILNG